MTPLSPLPPPRAADEPRRRVVGRMVVRGHLFHAVWRHHRVQRRSSTDTKETHALLFVNSMLLPFVQCIQRQCPSFFAALRSWTRSALAPSQARTQASPHEAVYVPLHVHAESTSQACHTECHGLDRQRDRQICREFGEKTRWVQGGLRGRAEALIQNPFEAGRSGLGKGGRRRLEGARWAGERGCRKV